MAESHTAQQHRRNDNTTLDQGAVHHFVGGPVVDWVDLRFDDDTIIAIDGTPVRPIGNLIDFPAEGRIRLPHDGAG